MKLLTSSSNELMALGFAIIRIGIGAVFIVHGIFKLNSGVAGLTWLGQQMGHLGITYQPLFWGICAMLAELIGGLCVALGFYTRIAAFFLSFVMVVAIAYHFQKGDGYEKTSFAIAQLIIFVGFLIAGSGNFSLDRYLW